MLRTNNVVQRVGWCLKAKDFCSFACLWSLDAINCTNRDNSARFRTVSPQIRLLVYTSDLKFLGEAWKQLKVAFTPVAGLIWSGRRKITYTFFMSTWPFTNKPQGLNTKSWIDRYLNDWTVLATDVLHHQLYVDPHRGKTMISGDWQLITLRFTETDVFFCCPCCPVV